MANHALGVTVLDSLTVDTADIECECRCLGKRRRTGSRAEQVTHVTFDLASTTIHDVTPYSEVYGIHPSNINFGKQEQPSLWGFIADPDAESDVESDSDDGYDEEQQPCISRSKKCLIKLRDSDRDEEQEQDPQPCIARTSGRLIKFLENEIEDDELETLQPCISRTSKRLIKLLDGEGDNEEEEQPSISRTSKRLVRLPDETKDSQALIPPVLPGARMCWIKRLDSNRDDELATQATETPQTSPDISRHSSACDEGEESLPASPTVAQTSFSGYEDMCKFLPLPISSH